MIEVHLTTSEKPLKCTQGASPPRYLKLSIRTISISNRHSVQTKVLPSLVELRLPLWDKDAQWSNSKSPRSGRKSRSAKWSGFSLVKKSNKTIPSFATAQSAIRTLGDPLISPGSPADTGILHSLLPSSLRTKYSDLPSNDSTARRAISRITCLGGPEPSGSIFQIAGEPERED